MKAHTFFETGSGNSYLYSRNNLYLLNVHPAVAVIDTLLDNNDEAKVCAILHEKFPEMSASDISFYFKKYHFLNKQGFFETIDFKDILSGEINVAMVENSIKNLGNIVFQVTNDCNLKCKYCCFGELYKHGGEEMQSESLDFNTVKSVFDFVIPYWNSGIHSSKERVVIIGFYGGEPLLNFSLIEQVVTFCKSLQLKHNTTFVYSITTNAILLHKYGKYLADNNFKILISLDGDEEADSLRVDKNNMPSFQRVFNNIQSFQKQYSEFFKTKVEFNSVLNSKTTNEKVHNFIYNTFGKAPLMASISSVEVKEEKKEEYQQMVRKTNESIQLVEQRKEKSSTFKELGSFFYYHLNNSFKHYSEVISPKTLVKNQIPTGTCLPFDKKMYVSSDKKIFVCERIGMQHALGNIDNKVNIDFQNVVDVYTSHYQNIKKQCLSCCLADRCSECMLEFSMDKDNQLKCQRCCNEEQYKEYLSTLITLLEIRPDFFYEINKMIFA